MRSASPGRRARIRRGYTAWLTTDVVLISLFALLGHLSHYGTFSASGVARTALPFLVAYLVTTAILRPWPRALSLLRTALPLWLGTAAGGLALRVLFGDGAAVSFQIVALGVLGLFLTAPRAGARLVRRRRPLPPTTTATSRTQGAST
ncbi:hypothetical protein GCM10027404_30940 [Arthrobacter tumbae]|uniref:DUF3054 domain-containing protein n=1 Tax=Arthrobacter tumbae TaxID=163874 RepID=UPI0019575415|nr:DUF3054 domain-containing protein [Arthrobacter tumbae]MBM7783149.1 hypothetical protein [Arthrobacter tumbae]